MQLFGMIIFQGLNMYHLIYGDEIQWLILFK